VTSFQVIDLVSCQVYTSNVLFLLASVLIVIYDMDHCEPEVNKIYK